MLPGVISIFIAELSKAYGPTQHGWASSNLLRAWVEQKNKQKKQNRRKNFLSVCAKHSGWDSTSAAERREPTSKVRSSAALCWSSCEDIPHVQGKRNPSKTVGTEKGHQRADRLKWPSETTSQSDHTGHSLSNSMKLSHAMWGHPRRLSHGEEVWQNTVYWKTEWQTTSVFLPWEPHEQYEKAKW